MTLTRVIVIVLFPAFKHLLDRTVSYRYVLASVCVVKGGRICSKTLFTVRSFVSVVRNKLGSSLHCSLFKLIVYLKLAKPVVIDLLTVVFAPSPSLAALPEIVYHGEHASCVLLTECDLKVHIRKRLGARSYARAIVEYAFGQRRRRAERHTQCKNKTQKFFLHHTTPF